MTTSSLRPYEESAIRSILEGHYMNFSKEEIADMLSEATRIYGSSLKDCLEIEGWEFDEVAAEVGIEINNGDCFFHAYFGEGLLLGFDEV